jgi:tRNA threonylcarbamoyladenosine biosynthesis protein TsaB
MALILNIDTSTEVCSVALAQDGKIICIRENTTGQNHSTLLTTFIGELLDEASIAVSQLDAVAISGGPGSYTGLRISVSVAKGICYGANLPLIAISSLESMANEVIKSHLPHYSTPEDKVLLCPMLDARRMEVYSAFYDPQGVQVRDIQADIIDNSSFSMLLENSKILFFGNGAEKCREAITHPNAVFVNDILTLASYLVPLSERAFATKSFVDVAYYEPLYLKDFVAVAPVKNIFHSPK